MVRREGVVSGFSWMLGACALLLAVYVGWKFVQAALSIATPFVVGFAFTLLLDPVADRIQTRYTRGRRMPAVALVFFLFLIGFGGLVFLIVPQLIAQTGNLVRFFSPVTYTVERRTVGERRFVLLKDDLATTGFTDRGLTNGTTYAYRVTAVDAEGQAFPLPPVSVTPQQRDPARDGGDRREEEKGRGVDAARDTTGADSGDAPAAADREVRLAPSPSPSASPAPATAPPSPLADGVRELPAANAPSPSPSAPEPVPASPTPLVAPTPRGPAAVPAIPTPTPSPAAEEGTGATLWRGSTGVAYAAEPTPTPGTTPSPQASPDPAATPAPPARVIATAGNGQVRLAWRPPIQAKSGFDDLREQVNRWLTSHRKLGPVTLPASLEAIQTQYADQLSQALQQASRHLADLVVGSVSTLITIVLIPIITFYLLNDIDRLRARTLFLLPEATRQRVLTMGSDIGTVFGGYVRGMLTVSAAYGLVAVGVFFACGLKSYALLLGFVAGVLYAIPFVGPTVTALLAATVSLATGLGGGHTLIVLGAALAQNQLFDNVIVPRVVGESVGLHPLITIFALFIGGDLFGIWGMLLSVPIAASIQVVLFRLFPKLTAPTPLAPLIPEDRPRNGREGREGRGAE